MERGLKAEVWGCPLPEHELRPLIEAQGKLLHGAAVGSRRLFFDERAHGVDGFGVWPRKGRGVFGTGGFAKAHQGLERGGSKVADG